MLNGMVSAVRIRFGKSITLFCSGVILVSLTSGFSNAQSDQPANSQNGEELLKKSATWDWPNLRLLNEQWTSYLDLIQADAKTREAVNANWGSLNVNDHGPMVLDRLLATAAVVERRVEAVMTRIDAAKETSIGFQPVDLTWFDSKTPGWLQENLKLAVARSYAQSAYYDEALQILESLPDAAVVDPSTIFFYRAVCYHHLLNKEKCVEQLDLLLQRESEIVSRYSITAKLMQSDLQSFKPASLDEVARLMNDVERRLDLGRAGTKVRGQEKEIVDKLDKLIDEIEKELQRQQQQKAAGAKSDPKNGQSKPLDESKIVGGSGPGDVDPKKLEKGKVWGDLPPAQRQESLQNITRDLPSHYREVIEAYFKKLGTGEK